MKQNADVKNENEKESEMDHRLTESIYLSANWYFRMVAP